jgi:hypothetical protein
MNNNNNGNNEYPFRTHVASRSNNQELIDLAHYVDIFRRNTTAEFRNLIGRIEANWKYLDEEPNNYLYFNRLQRLRHTYDLIAQELRNIDTQTEIIISLVEQEERERERRISGRRQIQRLVENQHQENNDEDNNDEDNNDDDDKTVNLYGEGLKRKRKRLN